MNTNRSPLKENIHPESKSLKDEINDLKIGIVQLQTSVTILQGIVDSIGIELKQTLAGITPTSKKQDEIIKKMNEEITFIKHSCQSNSSRSTSSEK